MPEPIASLSCDDQAKYLSDELQARMRHEPALFDWLQSAALDGLWYWDLENMENEWMSPEFKALFGYSDAEVPNTSAWWQEHIFPEDKKLALASYNDHITKGDPYSNVVRYRHKNGSTVWVRCRGLAKFNDQGVPVRMLGAHTDVTPLMRVQKELKQKEAVFDMLCSSALDGFWDWDIQTGKEFPTSRWRNRLGYTESDEEHSIEDWKALLHPDDLSKAQDAMHRHTQNGEEYSVVLRFKKKDETWAHMLSRGVAQKDSKGNWSRIFGTHTDVTYLEEARIAREANDAKSVFLATMSHEIRTPLNAVLGMAQVLLATQLTEEQEECVTIMQNSGAHLLSLINDILDFSQIESGIFSIAKEEFSIQKTVVSVLDVFSLQARQRGVGLSFESHLPAGTSFKGDSERICQILFNLVGNALKFTSDGSVVVEMFVKEMNGTNGVLINIRDTGCGMTEEQQKHIFDQFRQGSSETRRKYGGSGLGLNISKKLTLAMNGNITVVSELDRGSAFSVWLPGIELDTVSKLSKPVDSLSPIRRVLLYEPTESDTSHLSNCIRATDRDVRRVRCGDELISVLETFIPNALVVSTNTQTHECAPDDICDVVCKAMERLPTLLTIGIDKALLKSCYVDKTCRLPLFPTSDEIEEVFATRKTKSNLRLAKHIDAVAQNTRFYPLRVLIAEDIVVNQKVLTKLLARLPCSIIEIANNGIEAVDLACRKEFDLILMDCVMPEMDGLEATRIIRETNTTIAIVALTANATTADRDDCLAAGCTDFMSKPVSYELLTSIFKKVSRDVASSIRSANEASSGRKSTETELANSS